MSLQSTVSKYVLNNNTSTSNTSNTQSNSGGSSTAASLNALGIKVPTSSNSLTNLNLGVTEQEPKYADSYNPTQINSILDVVSSAFDPLENGNKFFSFSTLASSTKELWSYLTSNSTGSFIVNNLTNLGETMDVLANLTKAILPASWTTAKNYSIGNRTGLNGVAKRLQMATGIGIKGRYSFDIDFDFDNGTNRLNWLEIPANFIGEVFSDPINLATFGANTIFKKAATPKTVNLATDLAKSIGITDNVTLDILKKQTTKAAPDLTKAYLSGNAEQFTKGVTNLWNKFTNTSGIVIENNTAVQIKFHAALKTLFENADEVATKKLNLNVINSLEELRPAYNRIKTLDKIDKTISIIAGAPFFTPMVHLAKYGSPRIAKYINNSLAQASGLADNPNGVFMTKIVDTINTCSKVMNQFNQAGVVDATIKDADEFSKALHGTSLQQQVSTFEKIFNLIDTSAADLGANPKAAKSTQYLNLTTAKEQVAAIEQIILEGTNGQCKTIEEYYDLVQQTIEQFGDMKRYMKGSDQVLGILSEYSSLKKLEIIEQDANEHIKIIKNMLIDLRETKVTKGYETVEFIKGYGLKSIKDLNDLLDSAEQLKVNKKALVYIIDGKYTFSKPEAIYKYLDNELYRNWSKNASDTRTLKEVLEDILVKRWPNVNDRIIQDYYNTWDVNYKGHNKLKVGSDNYKKVKEYLDYIEVFKKNHLTDVAARNGTSVHKTLLNIQISLLNEVSELKKTVIALNSLGYDVGLKPDSVMFDETYILNKFEGILNNKFSSDKFKESIKYINDIQDIVIGATEAIFRIEGTITDHIKATADLKELYKSWANGKNSAMQTLSTIIDKYKIIKELSDEDFDNLNKSFFDNIDSIIDEVYELTDALDGDYKYLFYKKFEDFADYTLDDAFDEYSDVLLERETIINNLYDFLDDSSESIISLRNRYKNEQKMLDVINDSIRDIKNIIEQYDPRSTQFWLNKDCSAPVARAMLARAVETENLLHGASAQKLLSVTEPENVLSLFFDPVYLDEQITKLGSIAPDTAALYSINKEVNEYIQKVQAYKALDTMLSEAIATDENGFLVYHAVQNVLEEMHNVSPSEFAKDAGGDVRIAFMNKVNQKLEFAQKKVPVSLDFYRGEIALIQSGGVSNINPKYAPLAEDVLENLKAICHNDESLIKEALEGGHFASSDALLTEALFKAHLGKNVDKLDNLAKASHIVVFDSETLGLSRYTGRILQLGGHYYNNINNSFNMKVSYTRDMFDDQYPNHDILVKMFGDGTPKALQDKYLEVYYSAASKADVITEEDLLKAFDSWSSSAGYIIGMNNTGFDNRFIRIRSEELFGDSSKLHFNNMNRATQIIDVYQDLLDRQGVHFLNTKEQDILDKYCDVMSENLKDFDSVRGLHPEELKKNVKDALYYLNNSRELTTVQTTADFVESSTEQFVSFQHLKSYYEEVLDALNGDTIGTSYDVLRTKEWQNTLFTDFIKEDLTDDDWIKYGKDLIKDGKIDVSEQVRLNRTWDRLHDMFGEYDGYVKDVNGKPVKNFTESLINFKIRWLAEHNDVAPTSLQAVLNGGDTLTSLVSYKYIRKNYYSLDFNIDKLIQYSDAWEKITDITKRARGMVDGGRIKNLGAMIGEDKYFANSQELLDDLKLKVQTAHSKDWWAHLNVDNLESDAIRYAYWDIIEDDIIYRSRTIEVPTGIQGVYREGTDILGDRKYITPENPSPIWGKGANASLYGTPRSDVFKKASRQAAVGEELAEEVIENMNELDNISYRILQTDTAVEELLKLDNYVNFDIPGGGREYAATAVASRISRASHNFFKYSEDKKKSILLALSQCNEEVVKKNYTTFFDNVLKVDTTGKLTDESKKYLTQYLLFDAPYLAVKTGKEMGDADYLKYVLDLDTHADELKDWGINSIFNAKTNTRIYYLSNSKAGIIDYTFVPKDKLGRELSNAPIGKAKYNNITYYPRTISNEVFAIPYASEFADDLEVKELWDAINEARLKTYYFTNGISDGAFCGILTEGSFNKMFGANFGKTMPDDVLCTPKFMTASNYFATTHFNKCYLGPRNVITMANPDSVTSNSVLSTVLKQVNYAARRAKDSAIYTDLYFNKQWGMHFDADGVFKDVISKYDNVDEAYAEIADAFKHSSSDFVVAALVKDNTEQGYHAIRLNIETAKDIALAQKMNASIIPYTIYSNSFDVINNAAKAQHWYTRIPQKINFFYKVGYLGTNVGTWARNAIDSPFKTMVSTEDITGTIKYMYQAEKAYSNFQNVLKEMFKTNQNMAMSHTEFRRWFKNHSNQKLTLEEFEKLFGFFEDGPSSGEAGMLAKFRKNKNIGNQKNFMKIISEKMLKPMSAIERTTRLAQFLQLEDTGYTKTKIYKSISDVQFDYSLKSNATKVIENFIPFFNFTKMNFEFWIDAICKHPHLLRVLDDMYGVQQNSFNVTPEEAADNRSIAYHMMHGNLMLDSESGFLLKLNPSYMDAFNVLMEPINIADAIIQGQNKFSTLYGLDQYLNNSAILSGLLTPIQNVLSNTIEEYTIEEKVTKVPFGKYKGLPVEEMLKDPAYMQLMLDLSGEDGWLQKYYPNVWKLMMQNLDKTDRIMYWGKYGGQTIHDLMINNPEYCQYLLSQSWFREQYKSITDIFIANGLNEIKTMPWGKHKGEPMEEVMKDTNYIEYLMKQDWFAKDQPIIYNYVVNGQKTVVPENEVITDTVFSPEELQGILSYGTTLSELDGQNHFKNIMENVFKDTSSYPFMGTILQRFFGVNGEGYFKQVTSSSEKNKELLSQNGTTVQRVLGTYFPGFFGAAVRYANNQEMNQEFTETPSTQFYSSTSVIPKTNTKSSDKYSTTRYYAPSRNYNYYTSSYNKYKYNRGYRKYMSATGDLLRLKLGVNSLHIA